jgi:hypothetical protein
MSDPTYKFLTWTRILIYSTAFIAIVASTYCSCGKLRAAEPQDKDVLIPSIGGLWPGDLIPHPHIPNPQPDPNQICDDNGLPLS